MSELGLLLLAIVALVALFWIERIPAELSALGILGFLVLAGLVAPQDAFLGFSSPVVVAMTATFILATALKRCGLLDHLAEALSRKIGTNQKLTIFSTTLISAAVSAFMNNVAAVAIMIPVVTPLARRSGTAASHLFIPVSFGALLGGTLTLIGSPPNLVGSEILKGRQIEQFGFSEFTLLGCILTLAGAALLTHLIPRAIERRNTHSSLKSSDGAAERHELQKELFQAAIPKSCKLVGKSLVELGLGSNFGMEVLAVEQNGRRIDNPHGKTVLLGDARIFVRAEHGAMEEIKFLRNAEAHELGVEIAARLRDLFEVKTYQVQEQSALTRDCLREVIARHGGGWAVPAISHAGGTVEWPSLGRSLRAGDTIHALIPRGRNLELPGCLLISGESTGIAEEFLIKHLSLLRLDYYSDSLNQPVRKKMTAQLAAIGVDSLELEKSNDLQASQLIAVANRNVIETLIALSDCDFTAATPEEGLDSAQLGLLEVLLAPDSKLIGRSVKELRFRDKYDFVVVSVLRSGQPLRDDWASAALRYGDMLLLRGERRKFGVLRNNPDFVVVSEPLFQPLEWSKAALAIGGFAIMAALSYSAVVPAHVAAAAGALWVLLCGVVTPEDAYKEISWKVVFLVAALLPLTSALRRLDHSAILNMLSSFLPQSPLSALLMVIVLACLLSNILEGLLALIIVSPLAFHLADISSANPRVLMFAATVSVSIALITPMSHRAHMLIVGPGAYTRGDFLRVGVPLTFVLLALITVYFGVQL